MNILIPTKPDDTHSIYAHLALAHHGHRSLLWCTADFPTQQVHSLDLCQKEMLWYAQGTHFEINNNSFDVVWFRRPRKPYLPTTLHPEDKINAEKEITMFYHTLWRTIAKEAIWINAVDAAKAANSKVLQLMIAKRVGLQVPPTLVSNDKLKVIDFITHYGDGNVIYKTLYPMVWLKGEEIRLTYTKQIKMDDLPEKDIFQMTPGIFQQRINKAFELRVNYFGHVPVAVKIKSQDHPKGQLDWRRIPTHEMELEPFELPSAIKDQCCQIMQQLGLLFACFDFIVTKDNEYYFLELNESGQFLWIEEVNPEIKMLDIFTQFVIQKGNLGNWEKNKDTLSLASFKQAVRDITAKQIQLHLDQGM